MLYIIIFILLIVISIYLFINKLCKLVVYPNTKSYEKTYKSQVCNLSLESFFENLPKESFTLDSSFGYKLNGYFIPNKNSKKCIIICHGITANLYSSIKYANLFYKRGFSILIYDHRFHGLSGGKFSSMGYYEKYDLKTCADLIFNKLGQDTILGVFGESMGAGTVLQYCAIDNRIQFCIEDCGYSDVNELLKFRLKEDYKINIPGIIPLANKLMFLKYKWSFKDASPINCISNINIPILFIHGETDDYVPTKMVYDLYNAKTSGIKELYICPNADHAVSIITDMLKYDKIIESFLTKLNLL